MAREITTTKGLKFHRKYTREDINVFDQFEYDYRTSVIRNPSGEVVFEMNNVEVPKTWSQIATDIIAQKYFRKAGVPQPDGSLGRETSAKQVAHRIQLINQHFQFCCKAIFLFTQLIFHARKQFLIHKRILFLIQIHLHCKSNAAIIVFILH